MKVTTKIAFCLLTLGLFNTGAYANNGLPENLFDHVQRSSVKEVRTTPVPGIFQVKTGDSYLYITANGKYAFTTMYDLENNTSLTKLQLQRDNTKILSELKDEDLIVYPAKGEQKAVLTIFTDTSCPYCTKLHNQIPFLQEKGVKIRYAAFPRGGKRGPGFKTLSKVFCSEDKKKALDTAFMNKPVTTNCDNDKQILSMYKKGIKLGINGTPASFLESGKEISGYMPAEKFLLNMGL